MSRAPDGPDDVVARPSPEIPGRFDAVVPDVRLRAWMAGRRMIDGYWALVDGEEPVWRPPKWQVLLDRDGYNPLTAFETSSDTLRARPNAFDGSSS